MIDEGEGEGEAQGSIILELPFKDIMKKSEIQPMQSKNRVI